jgi:hypothetical protein
MNKLNQKTTRTRLASPTAVDCHLLLMRNTFCGQTKRARASYIFSPASALTAIWKQTPHTSIGVSSPIKPANAKDFSKRSAKHLKRDYAGDLKVFLIKCGQMLWVFYQCV